MKRKYKTPSLEMRVFEEKDALMSSAENIYDNEFSLDDWNKGANDIWKD